MGKIDARTAFLIIGLENQADVQYAMPVRCMLYDAEQYSRQVSATSKRHRREIPDKKVSGGEYLSGFYREDRILPVITIVIFWSADKWDGPRSIHEMIGAVDKRILGFVPDYKINLISPYDITEDDFNKFNTTLAEVLKYIKYSKNKELLKNVLASDNVFKQMDRESAELINEVTGSGLEFDKGKKMVNVCIATEEMKKEAADARTIEIAKAFIDLGKNTVEDIAEATKLPLDVIKGLAEPKVQ